MPFIPHTEAELQEMLSVIGVSSLEGLFAEIPAAMRPQSFNLPEGRSEMRVMAEFESMAAKNNVQALSFLGGGFYDHHISPLLDAISSRGEFLTAYTPYQPEASQGALQAVFEYQSAVTRLFELDCANASVYDGGSALFEAAMMTVRSSKKNRLVVDASLNPLYRRMLRTLTANLELEILEVAHKNGAPDPDGLKAAVNDDTAALLVQNPNFFGVVSDFSEIFAFVKARRGHSVISVNPVLQSVLKTPGEMGADIAVAEGQSLGLPLSFGGPYLGMMACGKELIRQMPGRIVGRTTDIEGRTAYVLTLQAREQHIRRAKATSNICSNQALCALRALIQLCLLGPEGLERSALLSMQRAREIEQALCRLPGVKRFGDAPYANEVAVSLPKPAEAACAALAEKGCLPGIPLGRWYKGLENVLLVSATEKTGAADVAELSKLLGAFLQSDAREGS